MSDWLCLFCRRVIRGVSDKPKFCPQCGLTLFRRLDTDSSSPSGSGAPSGHRPSSHATSVPEPSPSFQATQPKPISPAPAPRKERRGSKRVKPCQPLQIQFSSNQPLQVLDISASGLIVEHEIGFKFGATYEAELKRSDKLLRLHLKVVRSLVVGKSGTSDSAIRYRTAFQFVDAVPPAFFTLIPELSEGP